MNNLAGNVRRLRRAVGRLSPHGRRLRANWPALLRRGGVGVPCTVIDVSQAGAKLLIEGEFCIDDHVWLIVEGIGPIPAVIVWRRGSHAGLRFFEDRQWLAQLETSRFDPTAWLRRSPQS